MLGQLLAMKTNFDLPFLIDFRVDLYPRTALPLLMTSWSLLLIPSCWSFLTIFDKNIFSFRLDFNFWRKTLFFIKIRRYLSLNFEKKRNFEIKILLKNRFSVNVFLLIHSYFLFIKIAYIFGSIDRKWNFTFIFSVSVIYFAILESDCLIFLNIINNFLIFGILFGKVFFFLYF